MYDPDVIAYLFPVEGKGRRGAITTINMVENATRFVPARQQDGSYSRSGETRASFVREATEQPEDDDVQEDGPRLKLTFSNPPRTSRGLVAGRSPTADLVLPKFKGVSHNHFAFAFDKVNCLVVRDLESTVGTRVIYDTEDGEGGHGIDWSARGPSLVQGKAPVIKILGNLQFKLVVPDHDISSKTYLDNVARFREGTAAAEDLVHDIELQSRMPTELPTPMGAADTPGVQTPGLILWKRKLGQGAFAVVHYAWDVTTRQEYALKEPRPDRSYDVKVWRKEAEIMKGISHNHIVKLRHARFDDGPQLYFEYVPENSLNTYLSVTTSFHNKQIAIQLLSGLEYLHTREVPVTHREIKPENILIQHWSAESIHVKFADFGLSKQAELLETYCGTPLYAAPELYCLREDPKYSPLVDIWSVGVLLVMLECGQLATYEDHYRASGTAWAEALVRFVREQLRRHGPKSLLSFVLEDMLVVMPEGRRSALECHATALRLFRGETCETVTPSVELTSSQTTEHSSPPSSDEDSDNESNPATPRALSADMNTVSQDYGATMIASLGYRDTEAIDSRLGLKPSDMSEFQRSAGLSVEARRAAKSFVGGDVWFVPVEGEGEEKKERSTNSMGADILKALLGDVANAVATTDECAGGWADGQVLGSPSQCKRPRLEGFGSVGEPAEGHAARKRSKVAHRRELSPK